MKSSVSRANRQAVLCFTLLLALAVAAWAAGNFQPRPAAAAKLPGVPNSDPVILFDQFNDTGSQAAFSSLDQTGHPTLTDMTADDFVVPSGETWVITEVEAEIRLLFNSTVAPVNVYFFVDNGGDPGQVIYSRTSIGPRSGATNPHVVVPLPAPLALNAGHYWFTIQNNYYGTTLGDWQWMDRTIHNGYYARFVNEGDGLGTGCTTWNLRYGCLSQGAERDQMFRLNGTLLGGPSPTPTDTPAPPPATSTPNPSPTPCTSSFNDVHPTDYFYNPVTYLACQGVVSGYGDGTFRPYAQTTRAQLAKIVVLSFGLPGAPAPPGGYTFADVPPGFPFFGVIESAAAGGLVNGYACGGPGEPCAAQHRAYFRPYANVTRSQLAKIVTSAVGWPLLTPATGSFADVAPGTAFYPFVETAACHGIISGYACGAPGQPCDPAQRPYFRPSNNATRGQISKIVYSGISGGPECIGLK